MAKDRRLPIDVTILPNEIYYKLCLFRYYCPQFELGIEINVRPSIMGVHQDFTIPSPYQIEKALSEFFNDSAIDLLEGLGCVYFHYTGNGDSDSGYINFPSEWLACQSMFMKSYHNFYNNFNPKNYIYG